MNPFKAVWQLLWSLPIAIAWIVMATILYVGFGDKWLDKFIAGWNSMFDEPITLSPDSALDRKKGEGIG